MSLSNINPLIVAVGGAGVSTAIRLKAEALPSLAYIGVDIEAAQAPFEMLYLGDEMLKNFGSGGDVEVVKKAATGVLIEIEKRYETSRAVYILTGVGGGTGSALAPLIAEKAIKAGKLVIAFAITPFSAEGAKRSSLAKDSLSELRTMGCCTLVIPNELLLRNAPNASATPEIMKMADNGITLGIRGLNSMFEASQTTEPDFDKLRQLLGGKNAKTVFSCVEICGEQALGQLFQEIVACPLLHAYDSARNVDHLIMSVRASPNIPTKDIQAIASQLAEKFGARGEKITSILADASWTQPRMEVLLLGQPDPEIRKKQNAAAQAVTQAAKSMKSKLTVSSQIELGFNLPMDQRGMFDGTEPNIYRGEDVDIPAYIRRNVRIIL